MPNVNTEIKVLKLLEEKAFKKIVEQEVWKPESERRFILMGFILTSNEATNFLLKDETTTFFVGLLQANVFCHLELPDMGYVSKAKNNKLKLETTANEAGKLTGTFYGYEE